MKDLLLERLLAYILARALEFADDHFYNLERTGVKEWERMMKA